MSKCNKCGADIPDGTIFCPACGAKQEGSGAASPNTDTVSQVTDKFKKFTDTDDTTSEFDPTDIESNRVMAIFSYLSWLVLIPLIGASKSKYARFHVNQGILLAIAELVWEIVYRVLSQVLYSLFGIIHLTALAAIIMGLLRLVNLVFLVFSIIGIVNAANGKAKQLPIIGGITLIK